MFVPIYQPVVHQLLFDEKEGMWNWLGTASHCKTVLELGLVILTGRLMALVKCIQISSGLIPQLDLGAGCHGAKGLSQTQAFPESFSALAQESMTPEAQRKAL